MNPLLRPWLTPEWALSPVDKLVMLGEVSALLLLVSVLIVGWQELRRKEG